MIRESHKKKEKTHCRLKAIYIIGQRKSFCRQAIPNFRCARRETVDIISRNSDSKIKQPIRITILPAMRMRRCTSLAVSDEHLPKY